MANYYPIEFKINGSSKFSLWHTNEIHSFILESEKVKCFQNLKELNDYCEYKGFDVDNEVTIYDIDFICDWLNGDKNSINYSLFLNVWNIASDIVNGINGEFYGNNDGIVLDIYHKLFYGINPSSLKGAEDDFIPSWAEENKIELRKVLMDCISIINAL